MHATVCLPLLFSFLSFPLCSPAILSLCSLSLSGLCGAFGCEPHSDRILILTSSDKGSIPKGNEVPLTLKVPLGSRDSRQQTMCEPIP